MANFFQTLETVLKKDKRFFSKDTETLLRNKVYESAANMDPALIKLLLSNDETKSRFFTDVDGVLVFDKIAFGWVVNNHQFLPDSYTRFKNRIGLSDSNGELISASNDVVLSFPYKDCVLEGGQTKEDQKRDEVFYNSTLAPDDVDRLLYPKVLVGAKRYSKKGVEENITFKDDDNLIIKGNNLLVISSLLKRFARRVKLIYIDPPYNTGNDGFGYNDKFNHSSWLTFMKNRLEIARELLADDGAIFVQCDDNEQAYLKVLMDEIFGRENFRECISIKNGSESGVNAINVMRGERLFKVKEHLLYYAKNANNHRFNPFYVRAISFNESYRYEVIKNNNQYTVVDVYKKILNDTYKQDTLKGLSNEQKMFFSVKFEDYCCSHSENIYTLKTDIQKSGDTFKIFAKKNEDKGIVEEYKTSDDRIILVYKGGMLTPLNERIVTENGKKYYGTLVSDFWWDIGATPSSEGNVVLKEGKKPEKLLKRLLILCTKEDDIIMDFFSGSGSTCAVAHKMGRQYIGVEQLDYDENDSIIRLKNVINGDQTGISKSVNWKGGGSFVYCELAKCNQHFVDKANEAKTYKEAVELLKQVLETGFISHKVFPADISEAADDFAELSLADKKRFILELLDKNMLYVNLCDMNDKEYAISEADKTFTNSFYKAEGK